LEAGYRVPDDIAVIGFDDISLASLVQPPLTTIRIPQRELGEKAVTMLINHLKGSSHEKEVILIPELVIRESA
jgi:DNA-binding LacI/PurR family transcriptional regulator